MISFCQLSRQGKEKQSGRVGLCSAIEMKNGSEGRKREVGNQAESI